MHDVCLMQERCQSGSTERSYNLHLFASKHISLSSVKRRDSAVRLFVPAMAPKVFPGMQTVSGQTLTDYKTIVQNHLQVQPTLESNHCIACTASQGAACYYSPAGRTEYERTGLRKMLGLYLQSWK